MVHDLYNLKTAGKIENKSDEEQLAMRKEGGNHKRFPGICFP